MNLGYLVKCIIIIIKIDQPLQTAASLFCFASRASAKALASAHLLLRSHNNSSQKYA